MSQTSREHGHPANGTAPDDAGRHIEEATDEIFSRAQDAIRDVADRATHLAQDTLEHGRAGVHRAERSSRGGHSSREGRDGTSPFATALAIGAMGYAIATLIQRASQKGRPVPEKPSSATLPA